MIRKAGLGFWEDERILLRVDQELGFPSGYKSVLSPGELTESKISWYEKSSLLHACAAGIGKEELSSSSIFSIQGLELTDT